MNWLIKKLSKMLNSTGGIIIVVILLICFVSTITYVGFMVKRWFNWKFAYQDAVKELIRETVKIECLK